MGPASLTICLGGFQRIAAFISSCILGMSFATPSALAQAIPTVTLALKPVETFIFLDGAIQAVKQSTVSAQVSGRVSSLLVNAANKVKRGDLLLTIDDSETLAGQQRSQAQMDQVEANLHNATVSYDRTKDLQSKGFLSQAALDTAQAQLKTAKALHDQAKAQSQQSDLAQSFTKVRAPFDGWILQTDVQVGDLAVPGKSLLLIYASLPLRAVVQVPASRVAQITSSTSVQVQVGEAWITPTMRTLIPASDPVSQTMEWRLELPATQSAGLVPGRRVRVKLSADQTYGSNRLTVPDHAVVRRGELTAVYVQSGDVFTLRAVRLGQRLDSGDVEILAGLKAGDVVALDTVRAAQVRQTSK